MNEFAGTGERDGDGGEPNLLPMFVRSLARSLPWMILLVVLGAAAGVVAGLLQPNRFASNAKLFLRMGAREQLTSESLVDLDERQHALPPTMVDEMEMLSDVAIFEHVARDLGPRVVTQAADPERDDGPLTSGPVRLLHHLQGYLFRRKTEPGSDPAEDELRVATRVLREDTVVFNEPRSSVILLSSTSSTPELARAIVQSLANAFIQRHREQYSIESLLDRSRKRLEEAKQARDAAAKAYVEQVSQSGIVVLETQVPHLETELSSLEAELFTARVRREELGRVRTSLSNRLQGLPAEVEIQRPSVMIPNEDYETQLGLKRMLLAQKQEMLIQSRPSEESRRREKEFDNQIEKVDQRLKGTPKAIVQGTEMQENMGRSAMEARVVDAEVEDEALVVKLALLESRVEAKRTRLTELQKELLGATMMRKDLAAGREAEEQRYAHLLERFSVLQGLENINSEVNLSVLQAPTLDLEKVSPKRGSLLLKGLVLGLLAAFGFALLRQKLGSRLCDPESFEHARGVPVLGVVPYLGSLRRLRRRALAGGG
jgi:uncharacterized protein involved in exopolysaccharide biosynthesis